MNQWLKYLLTAVFLLPCALYAAEPAGKVVLLTGQATAVGADGAVRKLAKDEAVFSGDLINSGAGSYVNLRFADGGFFLLKPQTRFVIEDFRQAAAPAAGAEAKPAQPAAATAEIKGAAPLVTAQAASQDGSSRAFFRLLKGGFRSVSGLIGKANRDDYRVSTPIATIGIRGTKFGGDLCEGDCVDREEISTQLREAGNEPSGTETILVTTVEEGEISVTTDKGTTLQKPGTVLFTNDLGNIIPAQRTPKSIDQDQMLKPEACAG